MKQNKINNIQIAIQAFNTVRDIPYVLGSADYDSSCSSKVKLLSQLLERLGFSTRVMICNFNWDDLPLPQDIAKLAVGTFGVSKHYFLAVKGYSTENKWVYLDPTWDSGLRKVLPIAEWDGTTDTILAVPGKNKRIYKEQLDFKNRLTSQFAIEFNKWLEKVRVKV